MRVHVLKIDCNDLHAVARPALWIMVRHQIAFQKRGMVARIRNRESHQSSGVPLSLMAHNVNSIITPMQLLIEEVYHTHTHMINSSSCE